MRYSEVTGERVILDSKKGDYMSGGHTKIGRKRNILG